MRALLIACACSLTGCATAGKPSPIVQFLREFRIEATVGFNGVSAGVRITPPAPRIEPPAKPLEQK